MGMSFAVGQALACKKKGLDSRVFALVGDGECDEGLIWEALKSAAENYENLLNIRGDGIMGYVEIPKIDVNLPIYHGTGDDSLDRGVFVYPSKKETIRASCLRRLTVR